MFIISYKAISILRSCIFNCTRSLKAKSIPIRKISTISTEMVNMTILNSLHQQSKRLAMKENLIIKFNSLLYQRCIFIFLRKKGIQYRLWQIFITQDVIQSFETFINLIRKTIIHHIP